MNSFWFCRSASVLVRGFHCAVRSHLRGSFRFFSSRQRKFTVNGALLAADNVHYKVDFGPQNEEILVPRVDEGAYVMLYGPRASGKSSRVNTLMEQLKERYVFLNTSFQRVTLHKGEDVFWHSFSRELIRINHDLNLPSLRSPTDFLDLFHQHPFGDKKVVLIIDEFDSLYRADDAVQDSLLNPLRGLKHARDKHPLHSVIAAGTFSILNIVGKSGSPFNVREAVETPEFSLEQTRELFGQWVEEQHVKLDPRVVEDIHERTSGHVGFTNFCAKVLDEQFQDREKSLEVWLPYAAERLPKQLTRYPTCEKLVNTLTASDDIAVAARDLLDVQLMGASEPLEFSGHNLKIARFLADEGAIRETSVSEFAIRSDLVRSLLQSRVLVVDRPSPPKEAFPIHETDGVWRVDVEKLLEISVKNVNKEKLMANSDGKMCRLPKSAGAGLSGPAEAFYHHELYKVRSNCCVLNSS
eukprot:TRINITY_DN253_c0_g1_i1.p1 TRINITY_DN253_c0_g1~~TRINITY_DN253_c0_g1_i1.p1  ORF type:complete len:468 (-),score=77.12 TRINITY_DN253_c0_g1_i1:458-1861(-)